MKILKVSTNRGGGASKAADRQAKALREQGCEVKHLFVKQDWQETSVRIYEEGTDVFVSAPMAEFIKSDLVFQSYLENNRTGISNTYMSLWRQESPFDETIYNYVKDEKFQVVHFHWIANMVSSKLLELLAELNVTFVFTGHDMNHFTGGCHYDAGCGEHSKCCSSCPLIERDPFKLINKCHAEKTRAIAQVKPHFIYPSDWLNDEYQRSKLGQMLDKKSSLVLRNCVDIERFTIPSKSEEAEKRVKLGFEKDEIIVVSGAQDNNEIRKGFEHFEYSVKKINQQCFGVNFDKKISFVSFGGGEHVVECTHPNIRYRHLGFIDENTVRDLFQVADLLAFTSLEENFANIILESLMCATPVIGFNIGGVPDIVEDGINGALVKNVDSESFRKELSNLLLGSQLQGLKERTEHWSRTNRDKYSEPVIANELIDFYKEVRT